MAQGRLGCGPSSNLSWPKAIGLWEPHSLLTCCRAPTPAVSHPAGRPRGGRTRAGRTPRARQTYDDTDDWEDEAADEAAAAARAAAAAARRRAAKAAAAANAAAATAAAAAAAANASRAARLQAQQQRLQQQQQLALGGEVGDSFEDWEMGFMDAHMMGGVGAVGGMGMGDVGASAAGGTSDDLDVDVDYDDGGIMGGAGGLHDGGGSGGADSYDSDQYIGPYGGGDGGAAAAPGMQQLHMQMHMQVQLAADSCRAAAQSARCSATAQLALQLAAQGVDTSSLCLGGAGVGIDAGADGSGLEGSGSGLEGGEHHGGADGGVDGALSLLGSGISGFNGLAAGGDELALCVADAWPGEADSLAPGQQPELEPAAGAETHLQLQLHLKQEHEEQGLHALATGHAALGPQAAAGAGLLRDGDYLAGAGDAFPSFHAFSGGYGGDAWDAFNGAGGLEDLHQLGNLDHDPAADM